MNFKGKLKARLTTSVAAAAAPFVLRSRARARLSLVHPPNAIAISQPLQPLARSHLHQSGARAMAERRLQSALWRRKVTDAPTALAIIGCTVSHCSLAPPAPCDPPPSPLSHSTAGKRSAGSKEMADEQHCSDTAAMGCTCLRTLRHVARWEVPAGPAWRELHCSIVAASQTKHSEVRLTEMLL